MKEFLLTVASALLVALICFVIKNYHTKIAILFSKNIDRTKISIKFKRLYRELNTNEIAYIEKLIVNQKIIFDVIDRDFKSLINKGIIVEGIWCSGYCPYFLTDDFKKWYCKKLKK